MADLVTPESESPLGFLNEKFEVSKIESYELADFVLECHHQAFRPSRIANLCNKKLQERVDDKEYVAINPQNVKTFLQTKLKESYKTNTVLAPYTKAAINVVEKAEDILSILDSEVEKLREADSPLSELRGQTFIKLIKETGKVLELISTLQGKAQPQITFNLFQTNITKFCDRIMSTDQLTDVQKQLIITWATQDLLPPEPLKTVEGTTK